MGKHVIVIASGETERRSLPHLVKHLQADDISVDEVRIPPGGRKLCVEMAEKLVKAAWFEKMADPPDKFVVLVDADGKSPDEVTGPLQEQLPGRVGPNVRVPTLIAYAQWHLEAWYFADSKNLRDTYFTGAELGKIDTTKPDEIRNPKLHLKNLLGETVYTAVISEEIAKTLDVHVISQRSRRFRLFLDALRNGNVHTEAPKTKKRRSIRIRKDDK